LRPHRRLLWIAVAAGAAGLLASHVWQRHQAIRAVTGSPVPAATRVVGEPMPALVLPDLDGNAVDLAAIARGRPLLVNVWASWCGPCVEEMPELERFARSQPGDGVQVVGLALDTTEGVRAFLEQVPVSYPIVLDTPGPDDASVQLGNDRGLLPYTVLVDAQGRLARTRLGPFAPGEIEGWVHEGR
jgi:thiol-disulfide isomerase/thioredoxin